MENSLGEQRRKYDEERKTEEELEERVSGLLRGSPKSPLTQREEASEEQQELHLGDIYSVKEFKNLADSIGGGKYEDKEGKLREEKLRKKIKGILDYLPKKKFSSEEEQKASEDFVIKVSDAARAKNQNAVDIVFNVLLGTEEKKPEVMPTPEAVGLRESTTTSIPEPKPQIPKLGSETESTPQQKEEKEPSALLTSGDIAIIRKIFASEDEGKREHSKRDIDKMFADEIFDDLIEIRNGLKSKIRSLKEGPRRKLEDVENILHVIGEKKLSPEKQIENLGKAMRPKELKEILGIEEEVSAKELYDKLKGVIKGLKGKTNGAPDKDREIGDFVKIISKVRTRVSNAGKQDDFSLAISEQEAIALQSALQKLGDTSATAEAEPEAPGPGAPPKGPPGSPEVREGVEESPKTPERKNLVKVLEQSSEKDQARIIQKLGRGKTVHSFLKGFKIKRRDGQEEVLKGLHFVNLENVEKTDKGWKATIIFYNEKGEIVFKSRKGAYDVGKTGLRVGEKIIPTATEMESEKIMFRNNTTGEFEKSFVTGYQEGEKNIYHFINEKNNERQEVSDDELVKYGDSAYAQLLIRPEPSRREKEIPPTPLRKVRRQVRGGKLPDRGMPQPREERKGRRVMKGIENRPEASSLQARAEEYARYLPEKDRLEYIEYAKQEEMNSKLAEENYQRAEAAKDKYERRTLLKAAKEHEEKEYYFQKLRRKHEREAERNKEDYLGSPEYYGDKIDSYTELLGQLEGEEATRLKNEIRILTKQKKWAESKKWAVGKIPDVMTNVVKGTFKGMRWASDEYPKRTAMVTVLSIFGLGVIATPYTLPITLSVGWYPLYRSLSRIFKLDKNLKNKK